MSKKLIQVFSNFQDVRVYRQYGVGDRYVCRVYDRYNGKLIPSADYFTDNLDDAIATANRMCQYIPY